MENTKNIHLTSESSDLCLAIQSQMFQVCKDICIKSGIGMELQRLIDAVECGVLPDEDWRLMHDIWSPRNWHDIGHNVRYSFHGSLDAAKTLHDSLLPGWDIQINTYEDDSFEASVSKPLNVKTHDGVSHYMARAWLLAILKAYQQVQLAT